MLYLDHQICNEGQAFENNVASYYYPVYSPISGQYAYASPYKQAVVDSSVSGASMPSLSVNGIQNMAYSTSNVSSLYGTFALKDFNISITSDPDEKLLFETKYETKPKVNEVHTGLSEETQTYPIIYLRNNGGTSDPLAFGGVEKQQQNVRATILADSAYKLDNVMGIMKDTARRKAAVLKTLPFDQLGRGTINYTGLANDALGVGQTGEHAIIKRVNFTKVIPGAGMSADFKKLGLNTKIFAGLADFQLETYRLIGGHF